MFEHILRVLTGAFWLVAAVVLLAGLFHYFWGTIQILSVIGGCYLLGYAIRDWD